MDDDGRLLVSGVMAADPVTLAPDERLDVANDIMGLGRIRHMPVVADGVVVGVLSQRDLFRAAISSALALRPEAERAWLGKIHVGEVMSTPVWTAAPDWSLQRAVAEMVARRIGCLPVCEDGRLVGLVSESDCLRLLSALLAASAARRAAP